jgi:mucin-2
MNDDNSDAPQQSTKVFDISSDFDIKPANETDESTSSSSDVGKISIVKKNPTTSVTPTSNTTNPTINNNIPAQTRTPFPSKLNVLSAQANLEGRTPPVATPQPKPIPPITKPLTQTTVVNQPAPTIQTNTPVTPPPTSSPVTQTSPAPTLSTPTKTAQTPSSTTTPANTIYQSPNVRPIRTYEGDMAEILAHKRTSVATIAIAENKKKEGQEVISNKKTRTERKLWVWSQDFIILTKSHFDRGGSDRSLLSIYEEPSSNK